MAEERSEPQYVVIRRMRDDGMRNKEIAEKLGLTTNSVLCALYRSKIMRGELKSSPSWQKKEKKTHSRHSIRYNDKEKERVLALLRSGMTVTNAAKKTIVPIWTIYSWQRQNLNTKGTARKKVTALTLKGEQPVRAVPFDNVETIQTPILKKNGYIFVAAGREDVVMLCIDEMRKLIKGE